MEPVDETYFDSAPVRFAHAWSINRPAEEVWAEVVGDKALHWCRGLKLQPTSAQRKGVGTTRRATVNGLIVIDEYFFAWEEGRRCSFYFTHVNFPLFVSAAEDYLIEPDGPGRCRFTWRAGMTPTPLGRLGAPLNKLLFQGLFRDTGRYFDGETIPVA